ncbi:MAG: rhomboid family intramembrane serine protease [Lentimicrobiaceae bacterium]|jgi:membrane associated rhomboid family serine protease|nr:rhomboid family intramembrane serine protease [Lentimicrobiaceae bacterium]MDG1901441.1 rhomboid family intramembrane serine protease [Bacteroidales bacterium]MDG2080883.1 rhomboid family intramembrane serine protease [Bacteroidales bacterium]|tara:strand:+ start:5446 stop:6063 length:618 start_codon:yes stop_codon:yes gene_type:complete
MILTYLIIFITAIVSIGAFNNPELFNRLKFNAYQIKHSNEKWRFLSYGLVHSGWIHLLINMYVFYSFGGVVEQYFSISFGTIGMLYYVLLYVGGILFSTLFDFGKHKDDIYYNAVGASGAVSAVVFSSILVYPAGSIFLFPIPFPLPSWVFGIAYLIYSAYMGKKGVDNIGHFAHFWGAIFGLVLTIILVPGVIPNFFSSIFNLQ